MKGVLEGVRVLDFGRYIAGPYCAAMLGDMGAEVIRVEKTGGSEDRYLVPVAEDGAGGYFLQMNRNKRCLTLDPMKPEGREVVAKLVATADVVVANLPAQALEAMGLDYESLCAIKPDIILAANSAFGPNGPYSGRVGFDGVGQAMNGAMYMSGPPEEPMRAYVPYVDFGTALYSAFGTMAALMARRETGQGQHGFTGEVELAAAGRHHGDVWSSLENLGHDCGRTIQVLEVVEHRDIVASLDQLINNKRAYKTSSPRHQYFFLHPSGLNH